MEIIQIKALGQVGFKFQFGSTSVFIDPYLSNSVQDYENDSLERLLSIPIKPQEIYDADFVLITHTHRDHCDSETLVPIAASSPGCKFLGPSSVCEQLRSFGIDAKRIICVTCEEVKLTNSLIVNVVPSAHPDVIRHSDGGWHSVGYVIQYAGKRIYHAGDTSLTDIVVNSVVKSGGIDIALLPVNECNYMREKQGIIGNMSVREAFYFADKIGAQTMIPTHWDMFAENQVYKEEIELLYEKIRPSFQLKFGMFSI